MAFTIEEKGISFIPGTQPLISLTGTCEATGVTTGVIAPGHNTANQDGSTRLRKILAYSVTPSNGSGLSYQSIQLFGLKGSTNVDSENVDSAAATYNGTAVAANATVTAGAWAHGALTSPDAPRNVCIQITNDTAGNLNLYEGVMTFTVTGTDASDAVQTEDITFTSTSGNKAMGHAPDYRFKFGVKAFKTVTDITLDNEPANNLKIGAGLGSSISLLSETYSASESDILNVGLVDDVFDFSGKYDATNNTIEFGDELDAANDWLVAFTFRSLSGGPAYDVVKTYSTSYDANILTVTCGSGTTFDWWILGEDAGA